MFGLPWWKIGIFILLDTIILLVGSLWVISMYLTAAPDSFEPVRYELVQGSTIHQVADDLSSLGVVRSGLALQFLFAHQYDARKIKAGTYEFTEPQTATEIAEVLTTGQVVNDLTSVTFIEGMTVAEYGEIAAKTITDFQVEIWNELTAELEGQLFPETYFIPEDYTMNELVQLMQQQHRETLTTLRTDTNSPLTDTEVRILASILEREANSPESNRMVAGILLNRMQIGMPLQADATIEYILDTPLNELPPGQLASELRETESPYNTYKVTGLPPTPIGNPGRDALQAALEPTSSEYLFYITGTDGEFYYAETYQQHLINIERHLR